jgi:hypothetical protein
MDDAYFITCRSETGLTDTGPPGPEPKETAMPTYSYAKSLANAYKVNWRIEDVLGQERFDTTKRWLPKRLSGADFVTCLDAEEQRVLTQVEMAAYAHLFGYVEEFIAPKVTELAQDFAVEQREAFDALAPPTAWRRPRAARSWRCFARRASRCCCWSTVSTSGC